MGLWSRTPIYFPSMVVQMLPLKPQARSAIAKGRLPREVQFKVAPQHSKVCPRAPPGSPAPAFFSSPPFPATDSHAQPISSPAIAARISR